MIILNAKIHNNMYQLFSLLVTLINAQIIWPANFGYFTQTIPMTNFYDRKYYNGFIASPRITSSSSLSNIIKVGPIISTTNSFGETRSLVGSDGYGILLNIIGLGNIPVYSNAVTNVDYQSSNNNGVMSVMPSYSFIPLN